MELHVESPDGRDDVIVLDDSSDPVSFSGDRPTWCRVLDGPLVDLNLMTRRGSAEGVLDIVNLGSGDVRHLANPAAVVLLTGAVEVGVHTLAPFDAVLADPAPTSAPAHDATDPAVRIAPDPAVRIAPDPAAQELHDASERDAPAQPMWILRAIDSSRLAIVTVSPTSP